MAPRPYNTPRQCQHCARQFKTPQAFANHRCEQGVHLGQCMSTFGCHLGAPHMVNGKKVLMKPDLGNVQECKGTLNASILRSGLLPMSA